MFITYRFSGISKWTNLLAFLLTFTLLPSSNGDPTLVIRPVTDDKRIRIPLNDSIILSCSLDQYSSSQNWQLTWLNPKRQDVAEVGGRASGVHIERDGDTAKLYITHVKRDHAGLYFCTADLPDQHIERDIKIQPYEPINFKDNPSYVEQVIGGSPKLKCESTGQPLPEIVWKFKKQKIPEEGNQKYRYEKDGLRIFRLAPEDNGTYECIAEVASEGEFEVKYINLNVHYPPMQESRMQDQVAVTGDTVTYTCNIHANPAPTYEWYKEQHIQDQVTMTVHLPHSETQKTLTLTSVNRKDNEATYICRANNTYGSLESSATLEIQDPPVIKDMSSTKGREGITKFLLCEAEGYPAPVLSWVRSSSNEEFDIKNQPADRRFSVQNPKPKFSRLTIKDTRVEDTDTYICIARNPAGTVKKSVQLTVEYIPRINVSQTEAEAWQDKVLEVVCWGKASPIPILSWSHRGQLLTNSDNIHINNDRIDQLVKSTLTIRYSEPWLSSYNMYGKFTCTAKNDRGSRTADVNIREIMKPGMPANVTVVEASDNYVLLRVYPSSETGGSAIIKWRVNYTITEALIRTKIDGSQIFENEGRDLKVNDLLPGQTHTFMVSAGNVAGFGESLKFRVTTTEPILHQAGSW